MFERKTVFSTRKLPIKDYIVGIIAIEGIYNGLHLKSGQPVTAESLIAGGLIGVVATGVLGLIPLIQTEIHKLRTEDRLAKKYFGKFIDDTEPDFLEKIQDDDWEDEPRI